MSKIVSSADITVLDFKVLLDLSVFPPVASVTNLSTVVNPANLQWVFEFTSPSGTPLYVGNFTTPDVDGVPFATFNFPNPIQQLFGQVEYDNSDSYKVKVSVKDDAGIIYDLTKSGSLCKPNGNEGKNNFGKADITIETKCGQGSLFVKDSTNLIYKGIDGTKISTVLTLTYPKDPNGNPLTAVTVYSIPALLPIKYEGEGHEVYVYHIYEYDLGDYFTVRIRYSFTKVFPVWCNVTLEPLFCEITNISDILGKNCNDTADRREQYQKLTRVNTKMVQAVIGVLQPLSGFDVPKIIEDVKDILEIECDCCRPQGISNVGIALATDAIFTANVSCGDMTASFSNDGNGNIVLNLANKTYTFVMSNDPLSSDAFDFSTTQTGCNKETVLFVNRLDLATEILAEIQNNSTLLNILNSVTQKAQLTCTGLDAGNVMNLALCDYSIEIDTSAAGKTFDSIIIGGVTYNAPGGTLVTNAGGIGTYLNSLSKGTFVAVYSNVTNKLTITTAANANVISTVTTSVGAATQTKLFNNDCGLICNLIQGIFDYLNDLNLLQITTGKIMTICRFNADGTVLTKAFASTTKASDFATYLSDSLCNVVNYTSTRVLNCANLQALFATFTGATQNPASSDIAFMSLEGKCQQVPVKNLAMSILTLIKNDVDVKAAFCDIGPCSSVANCAPVSGIAKTLFDTAVSYTWSAVAGAIGYKVSTNGTSFTTVGSTIHFFTGLTANTAYTFYIYPVYASGDGSDCLVTDNFTTTNDGVSCAAPTGLVLDNVTDTSFRATWVAVAGASSYQYRVNGGGWIGLGALTVNVTGLTGSTNYNFEVRAIVGGSPCALSATDNATTDATSSDNITVTNQSAGMSIDSFSPAFFIVDSGALPLAEGESLSGIHGDYTGIISFGISGTFSVSYATLKVNGVQIECIDIASAGSHAFASHVYVTANQIDVIFDEGTCA